MQTPYEKYIPYKLRALLRISSTPTDLDEGGVAAHVGGEDDVAHQGSDRHPLRHGQVPQQVDVLAHLPPARCHAGSNGRRLLLLSLLTCAGRRSEPRRAARPRRAFASHYNDACKPVSVCERLRIENIGPHRAARPRPCRAGAPSRC